MDEQQLQQVAAQLRKPQGEDGLKTAEWMNKGNRQIHLDTFEVLNAGANDKILEIGMGNGLYVKQILEQGPNIQYTGCDFSTLMIEESKKINAEWIAKGNAEFFCSNADSLPLKDNSINKVFTINTIYFWEDKIAILNEIKRVLQPKGILIIAFRPKHATEKYPFTKYGFNQLSLSEVNTLLSENGFEVTHSVENSEPDIEMNGQVMKMENAIVRARINQDPG